MLLAAGLLAAPFSASAQTNRDDSFRVFLENLWTQAKAKGITAATFDLAFSGVRPDPDVIALTRREPEYGKPVGEYLASSVSPARISVGLQRQAQWAKTLGEVERTYGVDPFIILAIWGMART
jgi:membrane-bound lytic murein transglycosylase B